MGRYGEMWGGAYWKRVTLRPWPRAPDGTPMLAKRVRTALPRRTLKLAQLRPRATEARETWKISPPIVMAALTCSKHVRAHNIDTRHNEEVPNPRGKCCVIRNVHEQAPSTNSPHTPRRGPCQLRPW